MISIFSNSLNKSKQTGKQNKRYSSVNLTDALREVGQGSSVRKAAKMYGIPASTLRDAKHKKYAKSGSGANTKLSKIEELINYTASISL